MTPAGAGLGQRRRENVEDGQSPVDPTATCSVVAETAEALPCGETLVP